MFCFLFFAVPTLTVVVVRGLCRTHDDNHMQAAWLQRPLAPNICGGLRLM